MLREPIKLQRRLFSIFNKKPKAADAQVVKKVHVNKAAERFNKLFKWEVLPLVAAVASIVAYTQCKTQI